MPGANWPNPARFANHLKSLTFLIVDLVRGLSWDPRETFRISIPPRRGEVPPGTRQNCREHFSAGSLGRDEIGRLDPHLDLIAVEEGLRGRGGHVIRLTMGQISRICAVSIRLDATHTSTHISELGWACRRPSCATLACTSHNRLAIPLRA